MIPIPFQNKVSGTVWYKYFYKVWLKLEGVKIEWMDLRVLDFAVNYRKIFKSNFRMQKEYSSLGIYFFFIVKFCSLLYSL